MRDSDSSSDVPASLSTDQLQYLKHTAALQVFTYIEDIYFFEVNTKYISLNVLKILVFHECVAQVKLLIFPTHEMKYFWYSEKNVNLLFIFSVKGNDLTFFLVVFR